MATEAQIRANRANAQKSRGPVTAEGKARSRLNALKHGMRAEVVNPMAPYEDPAELEARIRSWLDDYQPSSAVERDLVKRAAKLSWTLDRIERYESAILARRVRKAMVGNTAARAGEVCELARKLFYMCGQRAPAGSGPEWDDDPWAFVAALEDTPEGTRWMIDRWGELDALIESGAEWSFRDQFKFIRLLGKHPADAVDDPELNAIVLAWEAVAVDWGVGFWRKAKEQTPLEDPAFNAWREWRALVPPPENAKAGWTWIRSIVGRELERLNKRLVNLEEAEGTDESELAERALFSTSDGAERLRRFQTARTRELLRTLDAIAKLRKANLPQKAPNEANPEPDQEQPMPSILLPPGEGGRRPDEGRWGYGSALAGGEASRDRRSPDRHPGPPVMEEKSRSGDRRSRGIVSVIPAPPHPALRARPHKWSSPRPQGKRGLNASSTDASSVNPRTPGRGASRTVGDPIPSLK